jgi:hypothetical protein
MLANDERCHYSYDRPWASIDDGRERRWPRYGRPELPHGCPQLHYDSRLSAAACCRADTVTQAQER